MTTDGGLQLLSEAMGERATRRRLTATLEKMVYASDLAFQPLEAPLLDVLYVGIGHGHDAMLNLVTSRFGSVTGVDPYVETDGNGDIDYGNLLELRRRLELEHRLHVFRQTIQEFLQSTTRTFDLIVVIDALHHMFVTTARLTESDLKDEAVGLFRLLRQRCKKYLVVLECERHGLRPFAESYGILRSNINYSTKQAWQEWDAVIRATGFRLLRKKNYIPFALHWVPTFLLGGQFGLRTVCNRAILHYAPE